MLDLHFTPVLAELICAAVDLDVPALDLAGSERVSSTVQLRPRRRGFAEEVLRAYAYQCAMCGFDGALGHYPVAIEAAHVRWYSQQGPDEMANALALCALASRAVRPGCPGHNRGPADPCIRPVRRQERSWPGSGCPRGQATPDPAPAPAHSRRRLHLLAPPAGLQGSSQNIDPGPLMPRRAEWPRYS
jgi:hypothetical protein